MKFTLRRFANKVRPVALALIGYVCLVLFVSKEQYSLNKQIERMLVRVRALQSEQAKLGEIQERFVVDINKTDHNIHALDAQIEQLVQHTKRYNLIFMGIPESENEDLTDAVRRLADESMGISIGEKDVEYAHRLKGNGTKPRPVLAKFARWKDKTRILYRRKSLPPEFAVEEDLTEFQMMKRRKLMMLANKAEAEGRRVRWSGKILFVDGKEIKLSDKVT